MNGGRTSTKLLFYWFVMLKLMIPKIVLCYRQCVVRQFTGDIWFVCGECVVKVVIDILMRWPSVDYYTGIG